MLLRDGVLERLDLLVLELHDPPADGADEVVVVVPSEDRLVHHLAAPELAGLDEAPVDQESERAVDGGAADVLAMRAHAVEELLRGEVPVLAEDRVEDLAPRLGAAEPL